MDKIETKVETKSEPVVSLSSTDWLDEADGHGPNSGSLFDDEPIKIGEYLYFDQIDYLYYYITVKESITGVCIFCFPPFCILKNNRLVETR